MSLRQSVQTAVQAAVITGAAAKGGQEAARKLANSLTTPELVAVKAELEKQLKR
ncbi:hypothetical protein [Streptomyces clavifer]|uniref:hypothetical protein n=1 Tax=Streptomyces clavifer TaxID=68188 RepID=UPI003647B5A0